MINKIVNDNMEEALKAKIAVVDFSASWCGPCKMLEPVLEEVANELSGKVEFYNADVDNNMKLAMKFGVSSVPSIFVFKDGVQVDMTMGFQPKAGIMAFISKHM